MSRVALLWLLLALACGTLLFHTSQKVSDGRRQTAALEAETAKERESLRVLAAEWGYLNQPARLEKLARAHLDLVPLRGGQFTTLAALSALPPPEAGEEPAEKKAEKIQKAAVAPPAVPVPRPKVLKPPPRTVPPLADSGDFGALMKSLGAGGMKNPGADGG